ncbi:hypothetical protein [Halomonas sp. BC2]|uniref:hypothetical protein n=1 Tax=Halomonas sp. BC2 TaxID=1670449 RepID=UPI00111A34B7|nr:hypothetical protein [Halomonas sp. BC2]
MDNALMNNGVQESNQEMKKALAVHFNLSSTVNYADVEGQIANYIAEQLHADGFSVTQSGSSIKNALSVSFFIRQPADIYIGHNLADKNYLLQRNEQGDAYINQFKHVFVPGSWARERLLKSRLCNLKPYQIHLIGSPRVAYLKN